MIRDYKEERKLLNISWDITENDIKLTKFEQFFSSTVQVLFNSSFCFKNNFFLFFHLILLFAYQIINTNKINN